MNCLSARIVEAIRGFCCFDSERDRPSQRLEEGKYLVDWCRLRRGEASADSTAEQRDWTRGTLSTCVNQTFAVWYCRTARSAARKEKKDVQSSLKQQLPAAPVCKAAHKGAAIFVVMINSGPLLLLLRRYHAIRSCPLSLTLSPTLYVSHTTLRCKMQAVLSHSITCWPQAAPPPS